MVKNTLMQLLVILSVLFFFSIGAGAAVVTGTLDATYPTWNRISDRPDGLGGYVDSANDTLPYEVLEIKTTAAGDTLTATIQGSTQFDSFLALYSAFSPAAPLSNILAADDDSAGYPHAQLTKSGLAANTSYYLVISSYSNTANSVYPLYGSYALTLGGSFTVVPKGTTTGLSASPNPSAFGQAVTLAATVTKASGIATPTGTVTFKDGTSTLGTGTLNASSQASLIVSSLPSGPHSITALYGGETKYAASTSLPLIVTVVLPPTVTGILPSSGSTAGGTSVIITGANLTGATAVMFGATNATGFSADSATQTTAISPAGADGMIADITVITPGGTSATSTSDQFTYKTIAAKNMSTNALTSLADALSAANPGVEIRTLGMQLNGNFVLDRNIFLNGGYDATYQGKSGTPTILNGSQTVTGGDSNAETLRVKGKLSILGGSLRVKDVKVMPQ